MIISQDTSHFFKEYDLVFVTGHPRSGTTVTHALVCSAEQINDYVPETSFLTGLVKNFVAGFNNDAHNVEFFGSKQGFVDYAGKQIRNFVNDAWVAFGAPKVLAFKDPLMMECLDVFRMIFPFARFIISVRDPFETVSSYCAVKRRQGIEVTADIVKLLARNVAIDYARAAQIKVNLRGQVLLLHYDNFFDGSYAEKLSTFHPLIVSRPEKVWDSKFVQDTQKNKTAWMTDKYGKKIDEVKKSSPVLDDEQRGIIETVAVPDYKRIMEII
ncbi:sulfotransferase [Thalassospira xiamenensis]|uniref:sulfotransferase family protein n=1 Tax=Thalassospira xiamenensis TaxID=220697 RepID=UPI0015F0CF98|nr:sulfotransferase [Thalassospira xiamenensis]